MSDQLILPLTHNAPPDLAGGKGHSLSRLATAGFQVPSGAILTTTAYNRFIDQHSIRRRLQEAALPVIRSGELSFADASARAFELIIECALTNEISQAIYDAYDDLGARDQLLAVRSSANLEDQPKQSFAGQHTSYLNIEGFEALVDAVKSCWASLWSEPALSYRYQLDIDNADVAMAVVIQRLIVAEVSGVLFSANPLTGARNEIHIDASYGSGEAVVSGQVNPDAYVLARPSLEIKSSCIGINPTTDRENSSHAGSGTSTDQIQSPESCLNSTQLKLLGNHALAIESVFDQIPQDIEWTFCNGELWMLQSRAMTNLPSPPLENVQWEPPEPGAYLQRSQWVEHVPDPVCTLFEDLHMRRSLQQAWGHNLIRRGHHDFEDTQQPASFCLTTTVNGFAYRQVGEPPRTGKPIPSHMKRPNRFAQSWSRWRIYVTFVPKWRYIALPRYLKQIRLWSRLDPSSASIEQLWKGIRSLSQADAAYWFNGGVWHAFSLSRGTEAQLQNFLSEFGNGQFSSGQFLSGVKSPAFDAQTTLFRIANSIRSDRELLNNLLVQSPQRLLDVLAAHPNGKSVARAFDQYFTQFGHQLRTLDFGVPVERESPVNTLRSLHTYLLKPELDPANNRERLKREQRNKRKLAMSFFRGRLKLKFCWRVWLARRFYPYREAAMFHLGRAWTVLRPFALELGERLADRGMIRKREDVFYLTCEELGSAIRAIVSIDRLPDSHRKAHYPAGASLPHLAVNASNRRVLQTRRRNLRPPFLIPGPPPWAPLDSSIKDENAGKILRGSPVSPGRVTGEACVIRSADDFGELRSGTILVCPTTTPAWTTIFPQVIGLVTDIGGILAHGSIVAREFGIPAVLGLVNATEVIQDGQTITIDGDAGTVEI